MEYTPVRSAQNPHEMAMFLGFLLAKEVKSYVEIGVREGGTFHKVATSLPKGALVVAIDYPNGPWGYNSQEKMEITIKHLLYLGYNAHLIIGDSTKQETLDKLKTIAHKFDAIFIDGDHRHDVVSSDYKMYGPLCDIVAFHDIVGNGCLDSSRKLQVEVPRLWQEIKQGKRNAELLAPNTKMGIGILF
jgi:predicted O-methyltransferase YrrM